jgi:hypothetical protein
VRRGHRETFAGTHRVAKVPHRDYSKRLDYGPARRKLAIELQHTRRSDGVAAALGRRFEALLDALTDPRRRTRTVVLLLVAYCAVWTLYAVIARLPQDLHFDMGEMVAWSREVGLGTPKHPPLPAWLVGAWFSVFPLQEWAYFLLGIATAAVSLGVAWAVAGRYLDDRARAVGLALLTFVPFFNFHAIKYNANTVMMPWWALTTWLFLVSFETCGIGVAALAGIAAAGAMLTKYWSIVLLAGLADRRRARYFQSAAPYVTMVAGAAALAPHAAWLWLHDFVPFGYALESHPATVAESLVSGLGYVAGALGYAAVPIAIVAVAAQPSRAAIADMLWPADDRRRLAVMVFALPLLLPTLLAAAASEKVVSLWAIGGMTLLPVVLLSSPRMTVSRTAAVRIIGAAVAFPLLALLVSPLAAVLGAPAVTTWLHPGEFTHYGDQYRAIAAAAGKVWHETTTAPLRLVGSFNDTLYGSIFYYPERPSTYEIVTPALTPWTDAARIARDGILMFCPVAAEPCMGALAQWAVQSPQARRVEVTIAPQFFGLASAPTPYVILAIPPR